MIIKHVTGAVVDTDKLPDVNAEILEKSEQLRITCGNNKRKLIILVEATPHGDPKRVACTSFWNLTPLDNSDEELSKSQFGILGEMDAFIRGFTNGDFGIAKLK